MIQTCYKTFISKQKTSLSIEGFDVYAYKASDGTCYLCFEKDNARYIMSELNENVLFVNKEIIFDHPIFLPVANKII